MRDGKRLGDDVDDGLAGAESSSVDTLQLACTYKSSFAARSLSLSIRSLTLGARRCTKVAQPLLDYLLGNLAGGLHSVQSLKR